MLLYVLIAIICVGIILLISSTRMKLREESYALSDRIKCIPDYSQKSSYEQSLDNAVLDNKKVFVSIATDIDNNFHEKYISYKTEEDLINHYSEYYNEAYSLYKRLNVFGITPSESIVNFIHDYGSIRKIIKNHNDETIQLLLIKHKDFFDRCLKYPLDAQQRRAILSEEDNCLVISGAGSGKTSTIEGKVRYLIDIKGVDPQKILLISYTRKAVAELTERIGINGLNGSTFHKLALDIISKSKGVKPSICDNTDKLFVKIFRELSENKSFRNNVVKYISCFNKYNKEESEWEQKKRDRREKLSEQKSGKIKAMFPDMDGNTIYVKSEQEQKICFILSSLGIKFKYEEPYEHMLNDERYSQYKPDFSIYFEQDGNIKRIYLEHFGVDEHGFVPAWFANDNNISYEEANKKYNDGITWKKAAHAKFGTRLLTTSSADFHHGIIKEKIKSLLSSEGVNMHELSDSELYNLVLPKESKEEKIFIRLIITFISLLKSSGKTFAAVSREARRSDDIRSEFMINNIFKPVYDRYVDLLNENGQIDFTDAIIQATDICKKEKIVEYEYIIVDEFQDISVDRYNFLKELRNVGRRSKLYCVGDDWQSIYRFSGSDVSLFNQFSEYFGKTEINKIETTYRFGEPLLSKSSEFIQRNNSQIQKCIRSFSVDKKTELDLYSYERNDYCNAMERIVSSIPKDKNILFIGRYSFDDYYLSFKYKSVKERDRFFYLIDDRKIEFLTVHKSKGLESDYVILLQCNNDTYGFPTLVYDDYVLNYVLTKGDKFPFAEERRLFYVAITRAKIKTIVLYDNRFPSSFVKEFLFSTEIIDEFSLRYPNANKRWTKNEDKYLLQLHSQGKSLKYISVKMGRSQTAITMRLNKLDSEQFKYNETNYI